MTPSAGACPPSPYRALTKGEAAACAGGWQRSPRHIPRRRAGSYALPLSDRGADLGRCAGSSLEIELPGQGRVLRARLPAVKALEKVEKAIVAKTDPKKEQLLALAEELGYYVQPRSRWMKLLAGQVTARLRNREGKMIYQVGNVKVPNFPLGLATQLFESLDEIESMPKGTTAWRATTMPMTSMVFASIFAETTTSCAGCTRALRKPSECVSRVVATIMEGTEASHVRSARGTETLYVNFTYAAARPPRNLNLAPVQRPVATRVAMPEAASEPGAEPDASAHAPCFSWMRAVAG